MKRRTLLLAFVFTALVAGGYFYTQAKDEQGHSRWEKKWAQWTQEKEPLPTIESEVEAPVDPVETQPLPPQPSRENLSYQERVEKGDYFFEKGFYSFANNEYLQALKKEPGRTDLQFKLVDSYLNLMDYDQAMTHVQTLLQLEPGNGEAEFLQALIRIKQSDFSGAKLALDSLVAPSPLNAQISYYRALLESLLGEAKNAEKLFQQAKTESLNPSLTQNIDIFLRAYQEFNLAEKAEGAYLDQLMARAYNEVKEYQMTVYSMKELLKERSELRDAWILYGFAYLNLGQPAFAKTAFERAYKLDSTWTPTQFFLGITHKELGNNQEAIKFFNFSLANQFKPEIVAQNYLGDLQFEVKNYAAAVKAYERVIELNNQDLEAYTRPIWIYLDFLNQPQKALVLAEIAMTLFPQDAKANNLLGWSQTGTGDFALAEQHLKSAIQLDPQWAAAHYNLGKLYQKQRRHELALSAYQKAYEIDQNGSIGNLAAQAYNDLLLIQVMEEEE